MLHMKKYQILRLSLLRPHKWVRHGHFYLICYRKQTNTWKSQKSQRESNICPQSSNYIFIFGIPVTAFSHATTARAQYKWRTMVKDRVQQPHVSILINLKGRFCYQRGIESIRQPMWNGCLSHKNTHTLSTQGAREANDNSNEWVRVFFYVPVTARSYSISYIYLK